jgi:hypothetical protein
MSLFLLIHIMAGATTLLAGPMAIFYNFKQPKYHRIAGKIFFYAMLVVCVTAWIGYARRPELVFYQFLLGISLMVFAGILRGVRVIGFMKGRLVPGYVDWAYTVLLCICGIGMLGSAAWHIQQGTMIAFPILFSVFGLMCMGDTVKNVRFFRAATVARMDWYRLHVSTMLGAFTASTTAFTVNTGHFLPWYIQWFGPTLLLLPLQFYFGRQLKGRNTGGGSLV